MIGKVRNEGVKGMASDYDGELRSKNRYEERKRSEWAWMGGKVKGHENRGGRADR